MTDDRVSSGGHDGEHTGLTTSLGLLERAKAQEPAAWSRLVTLYSPLIDHWCRACRVTEHEWADVKQEVFLAVWRNLGGFRKEPERGSFRGWLRTITRSKITDQHRKRPADATVVGSAPLDHVSEPSDGSETPVISTELGHVYAQALALLERDFVPATWRAFWLVAVECRRAEDVAAELGLSTNAVYLAKSRVLRRLRDEFGDFLDPPPDAP